MKFEDYIQLKDLATIEFSKYKVRFIDEVESNRLLEKHRIVAIPGGYYFDVLITLEFRNGRLASFEYDPDMMLEVFSSVQTIKQLLPPTLNITHVQMETIREPEENIPPKNSFIDAIRRNSSKMLDILRIRVCFDDVSHQAMKLLKGSNA